MQQSHKQTFRKLQVCLQQDNAAIQIHHKESMNKNDKIRTTINLQVDQPEKDYESISSIAINLGCITEFSTVK